MRADLLAIIVNPLALMFVRRSLSGKSTRRALRKLNWQVRDVSSTKPYDFECSKGADKLIVEVKGTTSTGEQIVITRNELATHRARYPKTLLLFRRARSLRGWFWLHRQDASHLFHWCRVRDLNTRPTVYKPLLRDPASEGSSID
jgi:hypothetical protein